jgi:hypothetical protein
MKNNTTNSAADCNVDDRGYVNDHRQLVGKLMSRVMVYDLSVGAVD